MRTNKHKEVGIYDDRFLSADLDFFYRMIVKLKMDGVATNKKEVVGIFRRGGISSTIPFRKLFFEEISLSVNRRVLLENDSS